METYQDIIVWVIILFAIVGFSVSVAYLLHCFKEKDASDTDNILPTKMEYKSTSTPYKDLWEAAGCSILDIPSYRQITWALTPMSGDSDKVKDRDEILYRRELLSLIEKGKKFKEVEKNNPELRKYCAEYAAEKLKNTRATIEDTLNVSNIMYNYIENGIMPNKEKEDNHG